MEDAVVGGVVSEVTKYLLDPIINQLKTQGRYLFCLKGIVADLNEKERQLLSTQRSLQQAVESAKNNAEIVEKDVEEWLTGGSNILADVQTLKEEVEANMTCLNCVGRYRLAMKAAKKTKAVLKLQEGGKFNRVSRPAPLPGIEFSAPTGFELFQASKSAFGQIIEALKNENTNVVGLYAMGGAGKTTLAKAVGVKVKEEGIFNEVVTVIISQTPNFKDIQDNLAVQLGMEKLKEEGEEERAKRLYLRFKNSEKKILVILDDVWKKFELKPKIGIAFDEDQKNCKILLTTRKERVCSTMGCHSPIRLDLLNEEEGLALLKTRAGITNDSLSLELNALSIEVARECKGLPLAIVTLGSALNGRGSDEWKVVSQKLKKSKLVDVRNVIEVDEDVYVILKFSYDNLNGEETKLCFLLCSLFPEDYKISFEELLLYGMGRGLFSDTNSIEEARSQLRAILNNLKASCLLLDAGEDYVKMHDMVRDVALWIASKGENVFMSKAGMTLLDWSKEKGWDQYTAICSMDNRIEELPVRLVCPKLEILLLSSAFYFRMGKFKFSYECSSEIKALKVLGLKWMDLSLKSLQFLSNLKTLVLKGCYLRDICFLGKLNRLEILSLKNSSFEEFPEELGELRELRFLDLRWCCSLKTIHSNVIKRFSQLEELYFIEESPRREVERTSVERRNFSLSELNSLPCLKILFLCIEAECLPKEFAFPKLLRYVIHVNSKRNVTGFDKLSYARVLYIVCVDATLLTAFKELCETLEYLYLERTVGCQNVLPSIDQGGLNNLEFLELRGCNELECVLDMTRQQVPTKAFSKLVELNLIHLEQLREICFGESLLKQSLEKLETLYLVRCSNVRSLIPAMLLPRLHKLKKVEIHGCGKLQELFQLEGLRRHTEKENCVLLPSLEKLKLGYVNELRYIWKGSTPRVNLQSLTKLCIDGCKSLECFFPINIAQGLVQLEKITIFNAPELKQLFYLDHEREENIVVAGGKEIMLPKLREVMLHGLENLISLCSENYYLTWPSLEELRIYDCPNLIYLSVEDKLQDQKEKLRVLEMMDCNLQLYNRILPCSKDVPMTNLEELFIRSDRVIVQFQVDHLVTGINGEEHLSVSSLADLKLEPLEELEGLFKDFMPILNLQNLTSLYISGSAHKNKHLFPLTIAQNLLRLQYLSIENCGELEQIIVEGDEQYQSSLKEAILFPNLTSITVEGCHRLKYLFPMAIVGGFQLLESIIVKDNFELGEVFRHKDGGDIMDYKEIRMPKIRYLTLTKLPSLTNFCTVDYHFIFPFLSCLKVEECPKITTRFSLAKDGSVHVEAKAPSKEGKNSIVSYNWVYWSDQLPPYIEEKDDNLKPVLSSESSEE